MARRTAQESEEAICYAGEVLESLRICMAQETRA
jgi:hypothetical protein